MTEEDQLYIASMAILEQLDNFVLLKAPRDRKRAISILEANITPKLSEVESANKIERECVKQNIAASRSVI